MKILLPVSGTALSLHAVRYALALRSSGLPASFVLANVQVPPSLYEVVVAHDAQTLDAMRRAAGADLLAAAEALLNAAGAEWESEVAGGEPGHVLVDLIDNYGCDLVLVMAEDDDDDGSSPNGGEGGSAIGSVTMALLQHSPVPVTVLRPPGAIDG